MAEIAVDGEYVERALMVGHEYVGRVRPDIVASAHLDPYQTYNAEEARPDVPRPVAHRAAESEHAAQYGAQCRQYGDDEQQRHGYEKLIDAVKYQHKVCDEENRLV